jgi:hypothetical protein
MTSKIPPLSPEELEELEVMLVILKELQEKPERFLLLFQPRLIRFWFFSERLFDKMCKLVKKEATLEATRLEAQLHYDVEQKVKQP